MRDALGGKHEIFAQIQDADFARSPFLDVRHYAGRFAGSAATGANRFGDAHRQSGRRHTVRTAPSPDRRQQRLSARNHPHEPERQGAILLLG